MINPNNQLSLLSHCFENCSTIEHIQWNIYQSLSNMNEWKLVDQMYLYENISIFGNQLFIFSFDLKFLITEKEYLQGFCSHSDRKELSHAEIGELI